MPAVRYKLPAKLTKLVAAVRHEYTLPPITVRVQAEVDGLCGYIERTSRGFKIVLARDSQSSMYHTLLHELAHAVHWARQEAGLSHDSAQHGDEFFQVYGALYRAHIEP